MTLIKSTKENLKMKISLDVLLVFIIWLRQLWPPLISMGLTTIYDYMSSPEGWRMLLQWL